MTVDWWTLGIEAVNVAVLIWLLGRFFWRPVAALVEQRRAAVAKDIEAAAASRAAAEKKLADIATARAGFVKEREGILMAAAGEAAKARSEAVARVAREVETMRAEAQAAFAKEREEAANAWRAEAEKLAIDIATRLLSRLDSGARPDLFLDGLLDALANLSQPAREAAAAAPLLLVSAAPVAAAEQENYRVRIAGTLGSEVGLSFSCDPMLLAGLALKGPNILVANNWRADLEQIQAELARGE